MFRTLPLLLWVSIAMAQQGHSPHMNHRHDDRSAAEWVEILEKPGREEWQKPAEVVAALALKTGESIADIGAGTGYFSIRFAKAVGPEGAVYAQDISEDLFGHLSKRAASENLTNLIPVLGAADNPRLIAKSVDTIFICDVAHHIENRDKYYPLLAKALKAGGRLVIVDFFKRELPVGPPPEMKIAKADMVKELEAAGFELKEDLEILPHQYFLVFQPRQL